MSSVCRDVIKSTANGNLNMLNLNEPLFVGCKKSIGKSEENHFNGLVQRFVVNGQVWSNMLGDALDANNVQNYEGSPCGLDNPCENQAECIALRKFRDQTNKILF